MSIKTMFFHSNRLERELVYYCHCSHLPLVSIFSISFSFSLKARKSFVLISFHFIHFRGYTFILSLSICLSTDVRGMDSRIKFLLPIEQREEWILHETAIGKNVLGKKLLRECWWKVSVNSKICVKSSPHGPNL